MLARARARLAALTARLGHDEQGWGSNAWAAGSTLTRDGVAILASDGHLPLSVPALFFQAHLDDALFGGGEHTLAGLVIPGVPNLGVGTNGQVAWSQTQFSGDQVDYYREEIVLGAGGLPESRVFQGGTRPLVAVIESYRIADAPALGSEGRTEVADRFETDDGRVLVSLEGTPVSGSDAEVGPGQAVVNIDGDWLVPGDVDGDGAVTAISFDFNAFDIGDMMRVTAAFGEAQDIDEWFDATRGIVTYSQSLIAADVHGNVLFTGYEGMPCRTYLPRTDGGRFEAGADPRYLVDGTLYPGFEIPTDAEGNVDETAAEPERCVVPWDRFPHALNPERGYVANANNDPGAIGFDNDLYNDEYYLGGPWPPGHRANRIEERLVERAGEIDADVFSDIQADRQSLLGREFASYLLAAVQAGRAASISVAPTPGDERLAALYEARAAQIDEVEARIADWEARSWPAMSGVETFYHQPDEQERVDAVATMLFNAWWPRFVNGVFDDEGLPGVFKPWGTDGRARGLLRMLRGAAPGNPEGLASFDEATGQSAFFDVLWTDGVTERWEEVALDAMNDGLAFLEGPDGGDGTGGFGTAEMAQWLWGLRHYVEFDSIVADFLGDDPLYAAIIDQFSITPDLLPIAASIPSGDPRRDLPGYPRPGDNLAVDAANTGTDETGFDYGSGPVMRLVVSLYSDGPRIRNVLPGGQSADPDSPFFADQAALWLGNQAIDVPFRAADVAAQAVGREVLVP